MTYHYTQTELRERLASLEAVLNTMNKRNKSRYYYERDKTTVLKELLVTQLEEFNRE